MFKVEAAAVVLHAFAVGKKGEISLIVLRHDLN